MVAGVGWGLGFPLAKLALRELDASSMILLRYLAASVLVIPIILIRSGLAVFTKRAVLVAGTFYGVAYLIQFEGLAQTTVSLAALLVGVMPILVALTARFLFREAISRLRWGGIALASAGACMLLHGPGPGSAAAGIAFILLSLVLCLGWIFALQRLPADIDPVAASCAVVVIGTLIIAPLVLMRGGVPSLHLGFLTWIGILGQSVLSTAIAIVAWQYGAARTPAASAGVFLNLEPLVGAVAGVMLFGDPLVPGMLLGGAAIVAGSVMVTQGTEVEPAPN